MAQSLDQLLAIISDKKRKLDAKRPLDAALLKNLTEWFRVELTYNSNAIEGNTLTRSETALVIEKGLTVKGKSLDEHLEAVNHAEALDYIQELATKTKRSELTKHDLLSIHQLILNKVNSQDAGRFRRIDVSIAGSDVVLPSHIVVPELMEGFMEWLTGQNHDNTVTIAAEAHLRLVTIHPFADGNGRTARLLMNLLLLQAGYPIAVISNATRQDYINSIEKAQKTGDKQAYLRVVYEAVNTSLDIYLGNKNPSAVAKNDIISLRIGELAEQTGEEVSTIRYWTNEGLLSTVKRSKSGYRWYNQATINTVREIQRLQKQRLTLEEIRQKLQGS
ncbi:MAG: Fic family protein [Patescibacteria group bacterium]